jgi:hypothetical protein
VFSAKGPMSMRLRPLKGPVTFEHPKSVVPIRHRISARAHNLA